MAHISYKRSIMLMPDRNCVNQVDPVVNTEDELRTAFKSIEAQAQKLLELNPSASVSLKNKPTSVYRNGLG